MEQVKVVLPKAVKVVERPGINWTWFKVRNGSLVAIFRLHYGEAQLEAFRKLEKQMKKVSEVGVPWAPWREPCEVVADHTGKTGGYTLPEVVEAFSWLERMFRDTAGSFERSTCSGEDMRHLEYHGIIICRIR